MSKLTIRNAGAWSCSINLLDRARELRIDFHYDPFAKLVERIERLRYVDEVQDAHQFWCRIDPETDNLVVAKRRVEAVLDKIERLLAKARKVTP